MLDEGLKQSYAPIHDKIKGRLKPFILPCGKQVCGKSQSFDGKDCFVSANGALFIFINIIMRWN